MSDVECDVCRCFCVPDPLLWQKWTVFHLTGGVSQWAESSPGYFSLPCGCTLRNVRYRWATLTLKTWYFPAWGWRWSYTVVSRCQKRQFHVTLLYPELGETPEKEKQLPDPGCYMDLMEEKFGKSLEASCLYKRCCPELSLLLQFTLGRNSLLSR